ncbi:porin-like protein [Aminobacter sp. J44]|nr:porin-like protein [Aminobacter sp. J44]
MFLTLKCAFLSKFYLLQNGSVARIPHASLTKTQATILMRNRTAFFALSLFISSSGYLAAFPAIAADADPGHHENQAVLACTGVGSGFFLIPGTDTCLRIGGQITAWHEVNHARKDLYAETSYLVDAPMVVYDTVEPRPRPAKQTTESVLTFTTASMTDLGPLLTFSEPERRPLIRHIHPSPGPGIHCSRWLHRRAAEIVLRLLHRLQFHGRLRVGPNHQSGCLYAQPQRKGIRHSLP